MRRRTFLQSTIAACVVASVPSASKGFTLVGTKTATAKATMVPSTEVLTAKIRVTGLMPGTDIFFSDGNGGLLGEAVSEMGEDVEISFPYEVNGSEEVSITAFKEGYEPAKMEGALHEGEEYDLNMHMPTMMKDWIL